MASLTSTLNISVDSSSLGVDINSTLVLNPGTLATNPNDTDFTIGTLPGLAGEVGADISGSVTASLTGDVNVDSSVRMKWNKNYVWIKNAVLSKFYTDYAGSGKQVGFVRVIVRKRR